LWQEDTFTSAIYIQTKLTLASLPLRLFSPGTKTKVFYLLYKIKVAGQPIYTNRNTYLIHVDNCKKTLLRNYLFSGPPGLCNILVS